jgi:hypothetical protein
LLTEFFYGISAEAKARRDKAMPLINDPVCTGLRRRVMPEGLACFIDPYHWPGASGGRDYPWLISCPLRGIFVLNYVVGFANASGPV